MELPFAVVEEPAVTLPSPSNEIGNVDNADSNSTSSSLVTASSQGSFINADVDLIPILTTGRQQQHAPSQTTTQSSRIPSTVSMAGGSKPTTHGRTSTANSHRHQTQQQHVSRPIFQTEPGFVDADFAYIDIPQSKSRNSANNNMGSNQPNISSNLPRMSTMPSPNDHDNSDIDLFVDAEVGGGNVDDDEDYEYGRATSFHSAGYSSGTGSTSVHNNRGDILAVLLSGAESSSINANSNQALTQQLQDAGSAAVEATKAKQNGNLEEALSYHTRAANMYKDAATKIQKINPPLSNSLLLLSQSQAKSAIVLKRIVKLNSADLERLLPPVSGNGNTTPSKHQKSTSSAPTSTPSQSNASSKAPQTPSTKEDRLRAVVRGALGSGHPREEDISDSMFLGRASSSSPGSKKSSKNELSLSSSADKGTIVSGSSSTHDDEDRNNSGDTTSNNPVDEMMELEQELRDMDMTLELGNSISSLDARMHYANSASGGGMNSKGMMRNSMIDGSFMVVPPGSQSYMASSMWGGSSSIHAPAATPISKPNIPGMHPAFPRTAMQPQPPHANGTATVRARANRLANLNTSRIMATGATNNSSNNLAAMQHHQQQQQQQNLIIPASANAGATGNNNPQGLESSWWGGPMVPGNTTAAASQLLTNSVMSIGSRTGAVLVNSSAGPPNGIGGANNNHANDSATTKQLMRLMDALKTLGDENATLLRQVEDAESARAEARAAKEQMKKFKHEYVKRFASLKSALEMYRKEHATKELQGDNSSDSKKHGNAGGGDKMAHKAVKANSASDDCINPVIGSEYSKARSAANASATEQLQRQEQLIRKLTADLKKEKDASRKQAAALRKFEGFYREVKARSAQKAAQRQSGTTVQSRSSNQ